MVCKLIVSTMVLHNLCLDHGLHTDIADTLESEFPIDVEEDHHSDNANLLRQQIVVNYFS